LWVRGRRPDLVVIVTTIVTAITTIAVKMDTTTLGCRYGTVTVYTVYMSKSMNLNLVCKQHLYTDNLFLFD